MATLSELRGELAAIDAEILRLAAKRRNLSVSIGAAKAQLGLPTRDYAQEREVVERARASAQAAGLTPMLGEQLVLALIRDSLTVQEAARVRTGKSGGGKRVLVIGGRGQMGRWFVRFLGAQGFSVEVADPNPQPGFTDDVIHRSDWRTGDLSHDLIVIAAPMPITAEILQALAQAPPPGVVLDVGSLKTPLRAGLTALAKAGGNVTSIHPMFGPDTELLSGRHVIFVDVGVPEATELARSLFASTMATLVDMNLDDHDRFIAYVLGLTHALNIAFFTALADSGESAPRLATLSSTTFDAQLGVAARVAAENPDLYFEIQQLNEYGATSLTALHNAVTRLRDVVASGDIAGFRELMQRGHAYLGTRPR